MDQHLNHNGCQNVDTLGWRSYCSTIFQKNAGGKRRGTELSSKAPEVKTGHWICCVAVHHVMNDKCLHFQWCTGSGNSTGQSELKNVKEKSIS